MERKGAENILLIIPELSIGGAQRSLANLSVELAKSFTVKIVIFSKDHLSSYTLGGELLSLEVYPTKSWLSKVYSFFLRVIRLRGIKKKYRINVSISFLEGADYINIFSRRQDRILISIRGSKYSDQKIIGLLGFLRRRLFMPLLYRRADKIICVSEGIRQELIGRMGLDPEKLRTLYNFYDPGRQEQSTHAYKDENFYQIKTCDYIIGVGRLHEQKNFKGLIDIYSNLRKRNKLLKLVVIGDGEEKEKLISYCHELELKVYEIGNEFTLGYDIFFFGFQNPFFFMQHATIFLLPSMWEGFPNVLMEAMACKLPILASDCDTGPREILAPHLTIGEPVAYPLVLPSGILMPIPDSTKNIQLWSDTAEMILKDKELTFNLKQGAGERVLDFGADKIVRQWLSEIYGND